MVLLLLTRKCGAVNTQRVEAVFSSQIFKRNRPNYKPEDKTLLKNTDVRAVRLRTDNWQIFIITLYVGRTEIMFQYLTFDL